MGLITRAYLNARVTNFSHFSFHAVDQFAHRSLPSAVSKLIEELLFPQLPPVIAPKANGKGITKHSCSLRSLNECFNTRTVTSTLNPSALISVPLDFCNLDPNQVDRGAAVPALEGSRWKYSEPCHGSKASILREQFVGQKVAVDAVAVVHTARGTSEYFWSATPLSISSVPRQLGAPPFFHVNSEFYITRPGYDTFWQISRVFGNASVYIIDKSRMNGSPTRLNGPFFRECTRDACKPTIFTRVKQVSTSVLWIFGKMRKFISINAAVLFEFFEFFLRRPQLFKTNGEEI